MPRKQPSEKQKAYWDRMNESGGWKLLGKAGGQANVRKYGKEHMVELGRRGADKLVESLGGMDKAKAHWSRIGKMKSNKETTNA